jgi:hypothetical protein
VYSCESRGLCIRPLQYSCTHLKPETVRSSCDVFLRSRRILSLYPFYLYIGPLPNHAHLRNQSRGKGRPVCPVNQVYPHCKSEFMLNCLGCLSSVKPEHTIIAYAVCVLTVGYCGHTVPWLSVIGYHHLFLAEPYYCPPCTGMDLKRQVVRPVCNTLSR